MLKYTFYDQNNNLISSLVESVIGSDKSEAVKIFDNKPLTFSVIESPIILDMDKLPNVSKIKIMPRNDDNYIVRVIYMSFYIEVEMGGFR